MSTFNNMNREELLANTDMIGLKDESGKELAEFTYKEWLHYIVKAQPIEVYEWRLLGKSRNGYNIYQTNNQSYICNEIVCGSISIAEDT